MPARKPITIDFSQSHTLSDEQSRLLAQLLFKPKMERSFLSTFFGAGSKKLSIQFEAGDHSVTVGGTNYTVTFKQDLLLSESNKGESRYQIIDAALGTGSFGTVYSTHHYIYLNAEERKAYCRANLKPKALKKTKDEPDEVTTEVDASRTLIPSTRSVSDDSGDTVVSMPALGEDLQRSLVTVKDGELDGAVSSLLYQSAHLLRQFHRQRQMVHSDIKPENICCDRAGRVNMIDFGLSQAYSEREGTQCGTPGFTAPELMSHRAVSEKTDVYALGVTAALLFGCNKVTLGTHLDFSPSLNGTICIDELSRAPESQKQVIHQFLKSMTDIDPEQRPTMATCMHFFNYMQNDLNPHQMILRASAHDFSVKSLSLAELNMLAYAFDIYTKPETRSEEYKALAAMVTDDAAYRQAKDSISSISDIEINVMEAFKEVQVKQSNLQAGLLKDLMGKLMDLGALEKSLSQRAEAPCQSLARVCRQIEKELTRQMGTLSELKVSNPKHMIELPMLLSQLKHMTQAYLDNPLQGMYHGDEKRAIESLANFTVLTDNLNGCVDVLSKVERELAEQPGKSSSPHPGAER